MNEAECDLQQLTSALTNAYITFFRLYREEMNNSSDEGFNQAETLNHRSIMTMIDRHFLDASTDKVIDPLVVSYVASVNTKRMNKFDRIRIDLVKLEVEQNRSKVRKDRSKRHRAHQEKQASCPVCMEVFKPSVSLVYPKCGHVVCFNCMMTIIGTDDLDDACPCCRVLIHNPDGDDLVHVHFSFNSNSDAICRLCDKPFAVDPSEFNSCNVISCGHAYHKHCLQFMQQESRQKCITCPGLVSTQSKTIFLQFY